MSLELAGSYRVLQVVFHFVVFVTFLRYKIHGKFKKKKKKIYIYIYISLICVQCIYVCIEIMLAKSIMAKLALVKYYLGVF